jgi:hypothetical protein
VRIRFEIRIIPRIGNSPIVGKWLFAIDNALDLIHCALCEILQPYP